MIFSNWLSLGLETSSTKIYITSAFLLCDVHDFSFVFVSFKLKRSECQHCERSATKLAYLFSLGKAVYYDQLHKQSIENI